MNAPAQKGLGVNPPSHVKNTHLIAWVSEMAALCKPKDIVNKADFLIIKLNIK